jgi:ribosomal-protein-alanine N-acetyltransferase
VTTTVSGDGGPVPAVRQAVRADLLEVFRIEQSVFPQPWPYDAFESFLGEPGFLVVDLDGEVGGYVVANTVADRGRTLGHLKDLAVRTDCQGRGLGKLLLRRALGTLRAEGARAVKLEVRETNERAIGLYRRHDFVHRRTIPRYYDDGEDALIMVHDFE